MIKDILSYQDSPAYTAPKWTKAQLEGASMEWIKQEWDEFQGTTDDEGDN